MQTIYFLVCIVPLPLFVWSQSNDTSAGRSTTVSSIYGNQLTTEHSPDVESASTLLKSDTLTLSVLLTNPYIEHPSTSEYKLTPSSVTMATTNTLDEFVTSSASEKINNFISFSSDRVGLSTLFASNSVLESVQEKKQLQALSSNPQSTTSVSASHLTREIIQPTVSSMFNKLISSDHQVVTNTALKSKVIIPMSLESSSMKLGLSSTLLDSKYMSGAKSGSLSSSSVLMETNMMDLKPSTDIIVGSSNILSDNVKWTYSTLMETTPLHSSGVGDSSSTVNKIVSSVMVTKSVLPLSSSSLSSSIEFTSHFVSQNSPVTSRSTSKSLSDSTVTENLTTRNISTVSMETSIIWKNSLSQEISKTNKISSTVFEKTKFSINPTISQQKSSSETFRFSDGQLKSSFVTQTFAGNLSPSLLTSVYLPDSSMILQPVHTTVSSKMDASGISDMSASSLSTLSSKTDSVLMKETFRTSRTEVLSSMTSSFVQTSGWTPLQTTGLFTVKSSGLSDIAIGKLSTLESLSLTASKQDIKSTVILISDTANSSLVTHPSLTVGYQSSFPGSVSSAFYPLASSLILTNFISSSLYQKTSQLHLESGSASITSDIVFSVTATTKMVPSLTISPSFQSESVDIMYSTAVSGISTPNSNIIGSDLFTSAFNTFNSILTTDIQTGSTSDVTGSQVMGTPSLSIESLTLEYQSYTLTPVTNMSQTLGGPVLTSADTNIIYPTASSNNTAEYLTSLTVTQNEVTSASNIIVEPTLTSPLSVDFNNVSSFVSSTAMFNASVLSSVILFSTLDFYSSVETSMSSVHASTNMMVSMATSKEFHSFSQSSFFSPNSTMFSDVYATTKTLELETFLTSLVSVSQISVNNTNVAMETSQLLLSTMPTSDFESFQTKFIQSSISDISRNGSAESVIPQLTSTLDISASTMDFNQTSIYPTSIISSVDSSLTTGLIDKISATSSISGFSFSTFNFSQNISESYSSLFVTMGTVFSSLPPESLPSMSSQLIMQTVTASSNQFSLYDNLTKTLQMSSVATDIMNSLMSITMGTMSSSFVTSDMSSIYLPIMSSISASGISTNLFSQTVQPSSQWSSVLVEKSSEIVPTPSTSVFLSTAAFSVKSSELILQTMTSSIVVLNSTESELLRTSIMPTSSLFISDSVNISSQLMSSNMSVPVYQQMSQFSAFTSILPSPSSIPISDNMINSSIESVTKSEILLETSSLNVSDGKMFMSSTPILTTRRQTIQTDSVLPVLSSAPGINSTSSVPSTTSSSGTTTPTTTSTTPPPTTTPNLADTYWVKTVIKVPLAENASSTDFLQNLESRLIIAYNRAYERQQQIAAGTFTPLKKRRRKKRLTQVGDTAIDIKESTRSSGNVSLSYTVEKAGTLVPAAEVIRTLGVLSDQEMAIILQYVIASKAETYKKSYDGGTDTTTSSNNLWIIGVALGGIVLLIIIIWIILCVVVKKHRATEKSGGGQGEPHLIGMKSPPGEEGEGEFDGTRVNPKYIEELAERGDNSKYSVQSPKRQTYEVNSEYQEQPEYAQVKKTKKSSPNKRSPKKKQSSDPQQGNSDYETVGGIAEDTELITSPSKSKRSGKRRKSKQPDTFENDEVAAKTYHLVSEVIPHANTVSDTRQYSADIHDDEELRKRKEQERKKNKQRIREKKRKERNQAKKDDDIMKEYLASQQEIDTVLEAPPADGLPDVFKDKSSKSPGESKEEMSFSNEAYTGDESLQEARKKMHRLLDDAFSLISPSASVNGSSANVGNETLHEDKKHEPLYITPPSYRLGEEPGLATWSPYRAADQVALISMPKKMQTTVISPDRRGGGKRPIALFNDSGRPNQPEILTDEPPKPIILKTRQLMSNNKNEDKKGDHHKKQSNRGSISQTKPVFNGLESDSAGLTNMKSSSLGGSSGGVEKNKNLASSILQNRKPSHNDNRKDSVEMTTLNGDVRSRPTNPHHAPLQVIPDGIDETDIVSKNVRSNEMPKTTIQSIRNELKSTSLSTSYRPERKASSTLADIA